MEYRHKDSGKIVTARKATTTGWHGSVYVTHLDQWLLWSNGTPLAMLLTDEKFNQQYEPVSTTIKADTTTANVTKEPDEEVSPE